MIYLAFVVAAAVAVFAVLIGVAFKAGADASQCGELEGAEDGEDEDEDEDENEDDSP